MRILNLKYTNPTAEKLMRNGGLSVSRSYVPSCRLPVDQTIEQTINCHAKSKGGIVGFSRNSAAYLRWCMARHVRAAFLAATLEMAGIVEDETRVDKDLSYAETRASEEGVQNMITSVKSFIELFSIEESDLFCLSSGVQAPDDIATDLLAADEKGKDAFQSFMKERLVEKSQSFYAPLKKINLKTF